MKLFLATLLATAIRDRNPDDDNVRQIANGVIAGALFRIFVKV